MATAPKVWTLLSVGVSDKGNSIIRLIDDERNEMDVPTDARTMATLAADGVRVLNDRPVWHGLRGAR